MQSGGLFKICEETFMLPSWDLHDGSETQSGVRAPAGGSHEACAAGTLIMGKPPDTTLNEWPAPAPAPAGGANGPPTLGGIVARVPMRGGRK